MMRTVSRLLHGIEKEMIEFCALYSIKDSIIDFKTINFFYKSELSNKLEFMVTFNNYL